MQCYKNVNSPYFWCDFLCEQTQLVICKLIPHFYTTTLDTVFQNHRYNRIIMISQIDMDYRCWKESVHRGKFSSITRCDCFMITFGLEYLNKFNLDDFYANEKKREDIFWEVSWYI